MHFNDFAKFEGNPMRVRFPPTAKFFIYLRIIPPPLINHSLPLEKKKGKKFLKLRINQKLFIRKLQKIDTNKMKILHISKFIGQAKK